MVPAPLPSHRVAVLASYRFGFFFCLVFHNNTQAQCVVTVDTANLQHINCPNGGAVGEANIIQTGYQNFAWYNISNGQIYGNGPGVASLSNLVSYKLSLKWRAGCASTPFVVIL